MASLFDAVDAKIGPGVTKRETARFDMTLLLFNARSAIRDLWVAADGEVTARGAEAPSGLAEAVEALRPIFGERSK